MDGFEVAEGVVVIAATNRPETLARPAAYRPLRRKVVPAPTKSERAAILSVHGARKSSTLRRPRRGGPRHTRLQRRDLANLVTRGSESWPVRAKRETLGADDFAAPHRIILGRREAPRAAASEKRASAHPRVGPRAGRGLQRPRDPGSKVRPAAGMALGSPVSARRRATCTPRDTCATDGRAPGRRADEVWARRGLDRRVERPRRRHRPSHEWREFGLSAAGTGVQRGLADVRGTSSSAADSTRRTPSADRHEVARCCASRGHSPDAPAPRRRTADRVLRRTRKLRDAVYASAGRQPPSAAHRSPSRRDQRGYDGER